MSLPHQVCNAVARSRMPGRGVLRLAAHMRSKSSLSMSSPSGMAEQDAGNTVLFKLRSSLIAAASLGMDQASKFSLMETWLPEAVEEKKKLAQTVAAAETKAEQTEEQLVQAIQDKKKLAAHLQQASALHDEQKGALRKEVLTLKMTVDKAKQAHRVEAANEREQFARQQSALDKEITKLQEAASMAAAVAAPQAAAATTTTTAATTSAAAAAATAAVHHPMLGALVADLGHKSVYLTEIMSLAQVPIWEKQRAFRRDRSTRMARDIIRVAKATSTVPRPFAGSIVVYEHTPEGATAPEMGILDGQHRVGALAILLEKGAWQGQVPSVMVEVHKLESMKDASRLFRDINKAEPVREIDMPHDELDEGSHVVDTCIRDVIDQVVLSLTADYPTMFSSSSRCRIPHLNRDVLRDELYTSGVSSQHGGDAMALMGWLNTHNTELHGRTDGEWAHVAGVTDIAQASATFQKALVKARDTGMYLGLDKSWLTV